MKKLILAVVLLVSMVGCAQEPTVTPEPSVSLPVMSAEPSVSPSQAPVQEMEEEVELTEAPVPTPTETPTKIEPTPVEEVTPQPEDPTEVVYLNIETPDYTVNWEATHTDRWTAWSLLQTYADINGIEYKTTGMADFVYLSSYDGYAERDYGPMSGWHYTINGEEPSKSASAYELMPYDEVGWVYVADE